MNRQLIVTSDGSHSIFVPELDEHYHSVNGAIQESIHVFINAGLDYCKKKELTIFEVGFGTGLNAFLSLLYAESNNRSINYISVEKYPLNLTECTALNYAQMINPKMNDTFMKLHQCSWNITESITPQFNLLKIKNDFRDLNMESLPLFDVVFFDAFAPNKQPDLWQQDIYASIFNQCNIGAIFVTYCSKGIVRRDLQESGFKVERIPGPPGKKEMLRSIK
jgi:tRNA U34 5-methylaminomethyl-2-thiouridine-forming methyltransferase MnmC